MTTQGSILGNRVLRTEDRTLITGQGDFTADLEAGGAYHMVFIRSPFAHGTITSVDTGEAHSMPGVRAVYTHDDINMRPRVGLPGVVPQEMARPHLARVKVRFVGDIVAAVVADSAAEALEASEEVDVDIEPLPAVTGAEAALAADSPLLYEEVGSNLVASGGTGPVEGLFDTADVIVQARFDTQRVAGVPMEPNACLARPGAPEGGVTVWVPTQAPHGAQSALARDLGLDKTQVRVVAPWVGGGFGVKAYEYAEWSLVALAAQQLGQPIRWTETRSENMLAMVQGRDQLQDVQLGFTSSGKITGLRAHVIADGGAYPGLGAALPSMTQLMAQGVYDIPAVEFGWQVATTNTTTTGAYRGAGRPEAAQMLERALDMAADELDIDPAELRRMNLLAPQKFPLTTQTGAQYDNGEYAHTLDTALAHAGYDQLRTRQQQIRHNGGRTVLGVGISCYVEVTAPMGMHGEWGSAQSHPDGTFTISAGTSAHGQGHATAFAQIASSILQVPMEVIQLVQSDTAVVPHGKGTSGSRSLQIGGSAIHSASTQLADRAREIAAQLLEVSSDDVELGPHGLGIRGVPGSAIGWDRITAAAEDGSGSPEGTAGELREQLDYSQGQSSFPFGTHVAVVEVDLDTGMVSPLEHIAVDDCGRILNPMLVEGQQHGGIAQGISQALYEEAGYDEDGNPSGGNLTSYTIPAAADLCTFQASNTQTPTHLNPLGAKGIGESATIGSTPAVHNAVIDALSHLGVRHIDMPLTPFAVWQAIGEARANAA